MVYYPQKPDLDLPDDPKEARARGGDVPEGVFAEAESRAVKSYDEVTISSSQGPVEVSCKPFTVHNGITYFSPGVTGPILAFDIETTGLHASATVTCVSAWDPDRGVNFCESTPDGMPVTTFINFLDEAPLLCAFNGVRFDVPFLARCWGLSDSRVASWIIKLVDPFESCKLALCKTFSLDSVLRVNGIQCKTGSGAEAVKMAKQGRWAELEEYCMADTRKTHQLVKMQMIQLP